jgi:hypothetical protein
MPQTKGYFRGSAAPRRARPCTTRNQPNMTGVSREEVLE